MMNEILPEDVVIQDSGMSTSDFSSAIQKKKKKNCEDFLVHRLERTGEDFLVSLLSYETLQQVSKTKPLPPPYPGIERYNKEKYDSAVSMVSQNILPYSTLEEWMIKPLRMKKEAIPSMDFVIREYIGQLHVRLVGSVNGLVCLHDTHWHHVLIWNPATGETKVLPGNRLDYIPIDYCFGSTDVGFGFDAKTNDYKVIIVATTIHEVHHPYLQLPLTSWCQDTVLGSETCFDIWLLHEFGVEESWTKLITIGPLTQINRPLGFWKNEYSLFLENTDGQLVLYDFSTQEMTDLHIDGIPSSLQMLTYMESLVSVRGGNELQEQESS
uniref:F-box associated domain-containing protein n=1 Tax=Fagus sylvatica TaxID=28930 RepID=A0A2N9J528_FAGSY